VGSEVLNFKFEGVLGATAGALEGHVLEEVGSSVGRICFRTRASINPDTDSSSLRMGVRFGCNRQSVRECGDLS
ncbi:hypothetical protein LNV47_25285, partial [Paucibacter sp. DJ4R-1]|nr:hypothetical protein [Paucibacter sp. DJ4R-1]